MCLGCQSPFGELFSLRNFGRSLPRSDGPSFRARWSSDSQTVSWDDGQLSMSQFRALSKTAFDSATSRMERLMYGLRPRMQLDHIRDCMSNQKQGYSFMLDPANKLERAYLELSSCACLDRVDGLMAGDGLDYNPCIATWKRSTDCYSSSCSSCTCAVVKLRGLPNYLALSIATGRLPLVGYTLTEVRYVL
jgi:hypothetical protein